MVKSEPGFWQYLILLFGISWLLAACGGAESSQPTPQEMPQQAPAIQAPAILATPAADSPAAGICGEFTGELVTITINPDIPDPRCARVMPAQRLVVVNQRGEDIVVRLGQFEVSIPPGNQQLFDLPFGEYLAPGVHQIIVSPCCGAELLLSLP